LYYLYYLKQKGIDDVTGKINYPQLRRTADINLTLENEQKLNEVFVAMEKIISRGQLPERMKISFCKKCSYYELCWVEE
jgi:CRISPR-associated exonuclease Cas4